MDTPPTRLDDDAHLNLPRGMLEGMGSITAPAFDTPDVIRDCLAEHYIQNLDRSELFKAAVRLSDDLKRRKFEEPEVHRMVLATLISRLGVLDRNHLKSIEKAVAWVFGEQARGLSCTGALSHEGLCFVRQRGCRFDRQRQELHASRVAAAQAVCPDLAVLLDMLAHELDRAHPSESRMAAWTYQELATIEKEHDVVPGNEDHPIYAPLRALADRIRARHQTQGYDRYTARRMLHLLEDLGWVKLVEKGKPGTRAGKSNGYMRVLPPPTPATEAAAAVTVSAAEETNAPNLPPATGSLADDLAFLSGSITTAESPAEVGEQPPSHSPTTHVHGVERPDELTIPHVNLSVADSATNTEGLA